MGTLGCRRPAIRSQTCEHWRAPKDRSHRAADLSPSRELPFERLDSRMQACRTFSSAICPTMCTRACSAAPSRQGSPFSSTSPLNSHDWHRRPRWTTCSHASLAGTVGASALNEPLRTSTRSAATVDRDRCVGARQRGRRRRASRTCRTHPDRCRLAVVRARPRRCRDRLRAPKALAHWRPHSPPIPIGSRRLAVTSNRPLSDRPVDDPGLRASVERDPIRCHLRCACRGPLVPTRHSRRSTRPSTWHPLRSRRLGLLTARAAAQFSLSRTGASRRSTKYP